MLFNCKFIQKNLENIDSILILAHLISMKMNANILPNSLRFWKTGQASTITTTLIKTAADTQNSSEKSTKLSSNSDVKNTPESSVLPVISFY